MQRQKQKGGEIHDRIVTSRPLNLKAGSCFAPPMAVWTAWLQKQ